MNLGAQLGPLSITKLSPNWACQMGPIHFINFLLSGKLLETLEQLGLSTDQLVGQALGWCSNLEGYIMGTSESHKGYAFAGTVYVVLVTQFTISHEQHCR